MGKRPILIADPDARAASLIAHGLRKEGFQVVTAQRGEEALALLTTFPALIFCETELAGINGFELCQSVRREPATRQAPFFFLSRRHGQTVREQAIASGGDDLFAKPIYARDVCTLAHLFAYRANNEPLIEGDLETLPLFYILRALTSGMRSGQVIAPAENAIIRFCDGRIISAKSAENSGEQALTRLLMLSQGPFSIQFGPPWRSWDIDYSLRDLVTFDEPRRRRFEHAVALMGGPDIKLIVDLPSLKRELPRMPACIEKIVRLFDGKRTLREAIRVSDLDEVSAAESILHLQNQGIVVKPNSTFSDKQSPLFTTCAEADDSLSLNNPFTGINVFHESGVYRPSLQSKSDLESTNRRPETRDLFALSHGGWFELPAAMAGKHLRQVLGDDAADEIERRLSDLDNSTGIEGLKPKNLESDIYSSKEFSKTKESELYDEKKNFSVPLSINDGAKKTRHLRNAILLTITLSAIIWLGILFFKH